MPWSFPNGPTSLIDFGELREGDANDDNAVTSADFFILRDSYNLSEGDENYDSRADFNEDGMVTSGDFFLPLSLTIISPATRMIQGKVLLRTP